MVMTTAREENGEFCVAVALATRTAGILTQLVKGAGCYIEPAILPIWVIYLLNWVLWHLSPVWAPGLKE